MSLAYAGVARRISAGLLDVALIAFLAAIAALICLASGNGALADAAPLASSGDTGAESRVGVLVALMVVIALAQTLAWWRLGGTPGMLALDCVVIDARTGARLGLAASALRCIVLWAGMAALGAGLLWALRDSRRRGLHDLAARSLVVRDDESSLSLEELSEQLS